MKLKSGMENPISRHIQQIVVNGWLNRVAKFMD